jgi:maltose alpha-D-glucosyltransferase / alpha-amylase
MGEAILDRSSLLAEHFTELQRFLPGLLADFLHGKRWFGGKARRIKNVSIEDIVPVEERTWAAVVVFARVEYETGPHEIYAVPLSAPHRGTDGSQEFAREFGDGEMSVQLPLTDALQDPSVLRGFYDAIERKSVYRGVRGEIRAHQTKSFGDISLPYGDASKPRVITGEQSNSSSIFGDRAILKIFRRVQEGVNPELEVGRFLTEETSFKQVPPLGGWLEYKTSAGTFMTLGVLQGFVPNQGDAWERTLQSQSLFWSEAPKSFAQISASRNLTKGPNLHNEEVPLVGYELCGAYLDSMGLLGLRTAELHMALASNKSNPSFAPEPYTETFQRQLQDSLSTNAADTFRLLRSQLSNLHNDSREIARMVLGQEEEIMALIRASPSGEPSGLRIRIHGDYHLGQVLCAANDFVIIDFEGEPGRPISDRIVKRSALQDVAGMLRSFYYAAFAPLLAPVRGIEAPLGDARQLSKLAEHWYRWVSSRFLRAYFESAASADFLPKDLNEIAELLRLHLMAKALFELSYELNNRPGWARIPLGGILNLLECPNALRP